ncbi:DUF5655 domain-containing protein [Daejeonella oryzae]|uniref:DUF5655 domain-containing protein n=1 Tax=Daejeonella oryzae TaxID=1122943 RepID=UPI00047D8BCC|nr:DUF5655 domain-containing protein [Daejeonella oryzae]
MKQESEKLWRCPKFSRQFHRNGQTNSCRIFALEQHFHNKPTGKILFEEFKSAVNKSLVSFKIESLKCCIHLVNVNTFAAVKVFRNKIRVDFSLSRLIENKRIKKSIQMSAHRYLYHVDIFEAEEIDKELMGWIGEAYSKFNLKAG